MRQLVVQMLQQALTEISLEPLVVITALAPGGAFPLFEPFIGRRRDYLNGGGTGVPVQKSGSLADGKETYTTGKGAFGSSIKAATAES